MADRLVVIGGDAAGMTAATNARRGRPDLEIVVLEKGTYVSYSACGIPYVVSGAVGSLDELIVRTPQELRDAFRIDVRTRHEVEDDDQVVLADAAGIRLGQGYRWGSTGSMAKLVSTWGRLA